jgi:hypothetical protein
MIIILTLYLFRIGHFPTVVNILQIENPGSREKGEDETKSMPHAPVNFEAKFNMFDSFEAKFNIYDITTLDIIIQG